MFTTNNIDTDLLAFLGFLSFFCTTLIHAVVTSSFIVTLTSIVLLHSYYFSFNRLFTFLSLMYGMINFIAKSQVKLKLFIDSTPFFMNAPCGFDIDMNCSQNVVKSHHMPSTRCASGGIVIV